MLAIHHPTWFGFISLPNFVLLCPPTPKTQSGKCRELPHIWTTGFYDWKWTGQQQWMLFLFWLYGTTNVIDSRIVKIQKSTALVFALNDFVGYIHIEPVDLLIKRPFIINRDGRVSRLSAVHHQIMRARNHCQIDETHKTRLCVYVCDVLSKNETDAGSISPRHTIRSNI
jgi:hypothetical protein